MAKLFLQKQATIVIGNHVILEHNLEDGTKIFTLYAHLLDGSINVIEGQEVCTGTVLGIMGSTGNSTGPHLHFEIRIGENTSDNCVNPYEYLFGKEKNNG